MSPSDAPGVRAGADAEGAQQKLLVQGAGREDVAGGLVDEGDARRAEEHRVDGIEVAVLLEQVVEEVSVLLRGGGGDALEDRLDGAVVAAHPERRLRSIEDG